MLSHGRATAEPSPRLLGRGPHSAASSLTRRRLFIDAVVIAILLSCLVSFLSRCTCNQHTALDPALRGVVRAGGNVQARAAPTQPLASGFNRGSMSHWCAREGHGQQATTSLVGHRARPFWTRASFHAATVVVVVYVVATASYLIQWWQLAAAAAAATCVWLLAMAMFGLCMGGYVLALSF